MNKDTVVVSVVHLKALMSVTACTSIASRMVTGMSEEDSTFVSDAYLACDDVITKWDKEQHPTHIRVYESGAWIPEPHPEKIVPNTIVVHESASIRELKDHGLVYIKAAMEAWAV